MDILREALANGILDLTVICKQLDMVKRQEYLNQHQYKIYQNKDGRWCTYLPGRRRIQNKFKESLEDAIVEYYKEAEENPTVGDIFREWNARRLELGRIKAATATRFDQSAIEADPELYAYILKAVTEGYSYEYLKGVLEIPCSRDCYYDRYRKFFYCLSRKNQ